MNHRFGIVNIRVDNNRDLVQYLRDKERIIVSPRLGGIRISPHFFNNKEDIDVLIDALKRLVTKTL